MKQLMSLQRDLLSITVALTLFGFAGSLVGVFIPLIILQSGAGLSQVAGFYVLYALIKLALNYPVVVIIQRYGAHLGLGAGFIAGGLQMAGILAFSATKNPIYLLAGAAALALTNAFLWNAQHIHISRVMDRSTKSSSMATMAIAGQIAAVIAPLLGGLIGFIAGPHWLLITALIIILTALVPLRHMRSIEGVLEKSTKRTPYGLSGAPRRDLLANFAFGIDASVGTVVWPIYLAVAIKTFGGIGAIAALAGLATVIVVWWAGRRGDRGHDRSVLRQGVFISSIIHVFRLLPQTPFSITLISTGYRASLSYLQNAWTSTYYSHAKDRGIAYVMSMEIAGDVAYVALWGALYATSFIGSGAMFAVAFISAALASWGCLLITPQGQLLSDQTQY